MASFDSGRRRGSYQDSMTASTFDRYETGKDDARASYESVRAQYITSSSSTQPRLQSQALANHSESENEDDDVYSFNDFEADENSPNNDENEESNVSMPQLHRAYSDDMPSSNLPQEQHVDAETKSDQASDEDSIEAERRQRMEAILSRWSNPSAPDTLSPPPLKVPITTESYQERENDDQCNHDTMSETFTNKSGNRTEDVTPLNDLDNYSADSADVTTPSPLKIMDRHHQVDVPSTSDIDRAPSTLHTVDAHTDHSSNKIHEPEMPDLHELNISQHDPQSENVSNLVSPTEVYRQSYRAANRYSDVEEGDDTSILHSPPTYESNPNSSQVESFRPYTESSLPTTQAENIKADEEANHLGDENCNSESFPLFLKQPIAPPMIVIRGTDKASHKRLGISYSQSNKNPALILESTAAVDPKDSPKLSKNTAVKIREQFAKLATATVSKPTTSSRGKSHLTEDTKSSASRRLIPENSRLQMARKQSEVKIVAKRDHSPALPTTSSLRKSQLVLDHSQESKIPRPASTSRSTRSNTATTSSKTLSRMKPPQDYQAGIEAMKELFQEKEAKLAEWEMELQSREDVLNAQRQSQVMLLQQQESFAEEVLLKQHITMLEDDVDELKAKLFELTEERDHLKEELDTRNTTSTDRSLHSRGIIRHVTASIVKNPDPKHPNAVGEDQVLISKQEFDSLIQERDLQEKLLAGFQRENEKLIQQIKKRDLEEKTQKAQFYDQQEAMNKELNRLRNLTKGIVDKEHPHHLGRSASHLQSELNAESSVRYLQEQLMEVKQKAKEKEKDLIDTNEKLRKDYRQLAEQFEAESTHLYEEYESKFDSMQHELDHKTKECQEHKNKIAWYIQNQVIIDKIIEEKKALSQEVMRLKRDKPSGSSSHPVPRPLSRPKTKTVNRADKSDVAETSFLSVSERQATTSSTNRHHPEDLKKIKELESIIKDLHESLQKRYPDSVTGLIRATSYTNIMQSEVVEKYEHRIKLLSNELEEARGEYQHNLRSLRQAYEQVKNQYDQLLQSQSKSTSAEQASAAPAPPAASRSTSNASGRVVNGSLAQAQERVRILEEEMKKLRQQHAKKVAELEQQLSTQQSALNLHPPVPPVTRDIDGLQDANNQALVHELTRKLELADEKIKALESRQLDLPPVPTPPLAAALQPVAPAAALEFDYIHRLQEQHELELSRHRDHASKQLQQMLDDRDRLLQESKLQYQQASDEQQRLWKLYKDEENKANILRYELDHLKRDYQLLKETPISSQLQSLENHIRSLEQRLLNREKELSTALEESRVSGKLELARLQGIHDQVS
jgi:hypothetical protein